MKTPVLHVKNVGGGYPSFRLNAITLDLQAGELAAIIGPNGSGKSTLMRMICGDLKTDAGSILLEQTDLAGLSLREKARRIAVVQQHQERCDVNVLEYVLMGRTPYRKRFQLFDTANDRLLAEENLRRTGLWKYRHHSLAELSGGERQLAAIAKALTQEPTLLLLDEPTSQLDIRHQVEILDLIRRLNRELGLTVLMIIHDLNLASNYCDRLILMKEGRVHSQGTPDELLNYQTVEEVYQTTVVTAPNPVTLRPTVFMVPDEFIENQRNTMK